MQQDRIKWNDKFRRGVYPSDTAEAVKRFYHLATGRKALDIAAGNGRNAVFLTRKGFSVDAVDISDVGLAEFAGEHPRIHAVCADLDQFVIPPARYDLILNVKFLNRRLYPLIMEGLKPDGVLIFQALLETQPAEKPHARRREFLLRPNELLHVFLSLQIVYYRESFGNNASDHGETATLVARKK